MRDHRMGNPRHAGEKNSDTWLTPQFIIEALGGYQSFDFDPCTPKYQPYPTALHRFTEEDDGLAQDWSRFGRGFMNPPYSQKLFKAFMARFSAHNHGTALIFAKTETQAFFEYVWKKASGLLFVKARLHFNLSDGSMAPHNSGAPSVLVAYGEQDLEILSTEPIEGQFVWLTLTSTFLVSSISPNSWIEAVEEVLSQARDRTLTLSEIYTALRGFRQTNRHPEAKIRQSLKRGKHFVNIGPGKWALQKV